VFPCSYCGQTTCLVVRGFGCAFLCQWRAVSSPCTNRVRFARGISGCLTIYVPFHPLLCFQVLAGTC